MKIKTKKQLNLPQLIEWAMENEIKDRMFLSGYYYVGFDRRGHIYFNFYTGVSMPLDRTFTVEVEEEITEDTFFRNLIKVTEDDEHYSTDFFKVRDLIHLGTEEIHAYIDGEYKLIWTKEKGLVE